MATVGQFSSEYSAVPPAAAEQGNSTAGGIPDENHHASHLGGAEWSYEQNHGAAAPTQATGYSEQEQWQHYNADGICGHIYPAGYVSPETQVQYDQPVSAPNQATGWDCSNYQNLSGSVAVPQAVYYTTEGWAYYGNGTQHWNQYDVQQATDVISSASNAGPYMNQQYIPSATETRAQEENREIQVDNPNTFFSPYANMPYLANHAAYPDEHPDGWQHRNALMDPVISEQHPRQNLAAWKWVLVLIANNILMLVNG